MEIDSFMNIICWSFFKNFETVLLKIHDKISCSAYKFIFINRIQNKSLEITFIVWLMYWIIQNLEVKIYVLPVLSVLPDDGSHKIRNMSEWF
jgi:hypothetical protein